MKTGIFLLSALSLFQLAVSQPHGHKHAHKRDLTTDYATVTAPEVIVWVYEDGETVSVETRTPSLPAATPPPQRVEPQSSAEPTSDHPSPSHSPSPSPVQAYAQSSSEDHSSPPPPPPTNTPPDPSPNKPVPLPSSAPSPPPSNGGGGDVGSSSGNSGSSSGSTGLGICYSPYNGDGTCKSQDQVNKDFNSLSGYSIVRIYGVDCNQVSTVTSAAAAKGISVFAGLLTISDVAGDLASLIKQVNGKFGPITTISIGNELVDMGKASVSDVVSALGTARGILSAAGYKGAIVTVDTFNALIANPNLCKNSDYCAANTHAYFDGTIEPSGAGTWVQKQVGRIGDAAGGKRVVITESGWPHAGGSNGVAVPSPDNQRKAIDSIKASFGKDLFLFTAFDDKWKQGGAWGVEQNFGIM